MRKEFKKQITELEKKLEVTKLVSSQITEIGEAVKKWQTEKTEIDAKIAGIENFQKLVTEQPDETILEFIKDVKRQLKKQHS
jgi:hypothetical protein